ncbi:hypothetical protein A7Q09_05520 [Methylacidiphilum sp. Yel]|uniref:hypothetical protein n=1 Tax=Methylacidiphilum sp. Yel TaxID=1847730 RepID=UPI00106C1150|nr:hypothetical protein [Methylacidiphilum sp. Yel]TFE69351.1 hypothetical protein A7Q09_05520 [Methylacidiphilum sp. Yel]
MAREKDAIEVMLAKGDDFTQYGWLSFFGKVRQVISRWTIGYGYRPWQSLWWILGSVSTSTFLFQRARRRGLIVPADPSKNPPHAVFQPLAYALETFIPLLDFEQKKFWVPDATKPMERYLRRYLWVYKSLGWILFTLFAAGVSGLVQKL